MGIPDSNLPFEVSRSDLLPIRRDGQAEHRRLQLCDPAMLSRCRTLLPGVGLELGVAVDGSPIGGRPHRGTVFRPNHGRDRRHRISQSDDLLPRGDIPDLELTVGPSTDHLSGVGIEGGGDHLGTMPFEDGQRFSPGGIPHLDQRIAPGRKQPAAVTAEFQVEDGVRMGLPGASDLSVGHTHQPHIARKTRATVSEGQLRTIARELKTDDPAGQALSNLPLDRESGRIPKTDFSKGTRRQATTIPAPGQRLHRIVGLGRAGHPREPRLLKVVDINPATPCHSQLMPRSVECQGGHRAEGEIRRLQSHGSRSGLIGQQTRVPREPTANPIPEGLDLARRQLLAGRHVRFGSQKDRRQQSTLLGTPLENHWSLLAALEHLLPSQQRKPSLLLGLAVARKAFVAQQRHRTARQRIARACGTRGRGQQQYRGPKGPEPEPELSWDAVDHGIEES